MTGLFEQPPVLESCGEYYRRARVVFRGKAYKVGSIELTEAVAAMRLGRKRFRCERLAWFLSRAFDCGLRYGQKV